MRRRLEAAFFICAGVGFVAVNVLGFTVAFLRTDMEHELQSAWVRAHVAAFACWLLLYVAQASLAAAGKRRAHRMCGVAAFAIGCGMIVLTALSGLGMWLQTATQPLLDRFMLSVVVHVDMVGFTILFVAGILFRRRDTDIHRRLMLLATVVVGMRFPIIGNLTATPVPHYVDQMVCVLGAIAFDAVLRRPVSRAYLWGGLVILVLPPAAEYFFRTLVPHLVVQR